MNLLFPSFALFIVEIVNQNLFRGLEFRPAYRQVSGLQSIINTCTLALSATATRKIQEDIYETLGFQTETTKVVAVLPDRYLIILVHHFLHLWEYVRNILR